MRKQPFHRKILPWIFVITFVGVAPSVVFYTAGYRWNPKKSKIERNGTVIIDSVPTNSDITIDGRLIPEKTPITIQNMAPGVHRFLLSKSGYHPWEKSFDVFPERVTFANDIKLFKHTEPILLRTVDAGKLSISTDDRTILVVSSGTSTRLSLFDTQSPASTRSTGVLPMSVSTIFWSPNGRYALVETTDASSSAWLLDSNGTSQLTQLPAGHYRWEGSQLVGNDGTSRIEIRLPNFSFTRMPLPSRNIDALDSHLLMTATGTSDIIYVDSRAPLQGFLLPQKNWVFWSENKNVLLLRDRRSWLSLVMRGNSVEYHTAQGNMLLPDVSSKIPQYLLLNDTEIWSWNPLSDPELLLRQSGALVNAIWDADGKNVFYATERNVIALNLDTRNGRLETTLAQFDRVFDLVLTEKTLYILASKNNTTGIWQLVIE